MEGSARKKGQHASELIDTKRIALRDWRGKPTKERGLRKQ